MLSIAWSETKKYFADDRHWRWLVPFAGGWLAHVLATIVIK